MEVYSITPVTPLELRLSGCKYLLIRVIREKRSHINPTETTVAEHRDIQNAADSPQSTPVYPPQ